jgi:outer membrane PBP1 activator LpoA protein
MPVSACVARRVDRLAIYALVAAASIALGACTGAPARPAQREAATPPPRPIIAAPAPATPIATAPVGTPLRIPAPAMTPPAAVNPPEPAAVPEPAPPATAPSASRMALPASAPETPGATNHIVLVLPLAAASYARAAEAFRDGFLAAAAAAGATDDCVVIPHDEDGVLAAFEDARERRPSVIVGPLVRDDLKVLAELGLDPPFTVALNQLDDGVALPPRVYSFPLAIESDARVIARRVRADGAQSIAIISTETPLMKRFANAFASDWRGSGGVLPDVYKFDGSTDGLGTMRRTLARKPAAALVLALDSGNATLAKPYLGTAPAFASGLVFEPVPESIARDLDHLVLVELPWIVTPDAPQFAGLPRADFPSAALQRLYAFGLDAFRVARAFREGPPRQFRLEGATGTITLDGRQFAREGRLAVFQAGRLVPLDAPPP